MISHVHAPGDAPLRLAHALQHHRPAVSSRYAPCGDLEVSWQQQQAQRRQQSKRGREARTTPTFTLSGEGSARKASVTPRMGSLAAGSTCPNHDAIALLVIAAAACPRRRCRPIAAAARDIAMRALREGEAVVDRVRRRWSVELQGRGSSAVVVCALLPRGEEVAAGSGLWGCWEA